VGQRLKKLIVALISLALTTSTAYGASKSPTPTAKSTAKPTVKATAKTTSKPTAKPTAKASAKPSTKPTAKTTVKTTATPSKKAATAKATMKAKPKPKPIPKRTKKISPSPKPVWPPKNYAQNGDIYAKVPTSKELLGIASANTRLSKELTQCETYTCGAILAASLVGCEWWELTADVVGPTSETDPTLIKYGSLVTYYGATKPKAINPFVLISQEEIKPGFKTSGIKIACHRDPIPEGLQVPGNTYQKVTA
jgi:hypothetical protein